MTRPVQFHFHRELPKLDFGVDVGLVIDSPPEEGEKDREQRVNSKGIPGNASGHFFEKRTKAHQPKRNKISEKPK